MNRDLLGRAVREAWVRWAAKQKNPKPSWLLGYDDLDESDKELDRQIGESIEILVRLEIDSLMGSPKYDGAIEAAKVILSVHCANHDPQIFGMIEKAKRVSSALLDLTNSR